MGLLLPRLHGPGGYPGSAELSVAGKAFPVLRSRVPVPSITAIALRWSNLPPLCACLWLSVCVCAYVCAQPNFVHLALESCIPALYTLTQIDASRACLPHFPCQAYRKRTSLDVVDGLLHGPGGWRGWLGPLGIDLRVRQLSPQSEAYMLRASLQHPA